MRSKSRYPHQKTNKITWPFESQARSTSTKRSTTRTYYSSKDGQVFTETEVPFTAKQRSDWIGELRTPDLVQKRRANDQGARKLLDMVVNKLPHHFRDLNAEHFTGIPWALAEKIWNEIISSRGESFHAWRTFAIAYPSPHEFGDNSHRYFLQLKQPSLPLDEYVKGITSADTSWLVSLRVSPKQLGIAGLVKLIRIVNLIVLDLSDGQATITDKQSPFNERVMRAWSEQTIVDHSWSRLRVLLFGWQENLGPWLFRYVDNLPSLTQIIITDCDKMHQKNRSEWETIAQAHGWEARHAKKSAKALRPLIDDGKLPTGAVSGCYYVTDLTNLQASPAPLVQNIVLRPVLECWLGSPRVWTHIVDDFPGTRTIYFDKVRPSRIKSTRHDTLQSRSAGDQPKRLRERDHKLSGSISPPPKRGGQIKVYPRTQPKNVADLLGEFMS